MYFFILDETSFLLTSSNLSIPEQFFTPPNSNLSIPERLRIFLLQSCENERLIFHKEKKVEEILRSGILASLGAFAQAPPSLQRLVEQLIFKNTTIFDHATMPQ